MGRVAGRASRGTENPQVHEVERVAPSRAPHLIETVTKSPGPIEWFKLERLLCTEWALRVSPLLPLNPQMRT